MKQDPPYSFTRICYSSDVEKLMCEFLKLPTLLQFVWHQNMQNSKLLEEQVVDL